MKGIHPVVYSTRFKFSIGVLSRDGGIFSSVCVGVYSECRSIKMINSKMDLLSGWMAVPTSLGAPVPRIVSIVSIGTSLEVANSSSEVVCPLLQK